MGAAGRLTSRRKGASRVTLQQVAIRAGVAPMTVSRALRSPDAVSKTIRSLVLQVVEELGYVPNRIAGSLASAATPIIPLIVPALANAAFIDMIEGVQAETEAAGFELLLATTHYDLEREAELVRTLLGWAPAGLIIAGCRHLPRTRRMLEAFGRPLVEVMELGFDPIDMNVGLSHIRAGAAVGQHLIDRGRRQIGFVCGSMQADYRAAQRFRGFDRVLGSAGLPRRPPIVHAGSSSQQLGGDLLVEILATDPTLDALFFSNDDLAVGAILRARHEGLSVPERIAIVGFNGLETGALISPSLTTVLTPRRQMGVTAARQVFERIRRDERAPSRTDVGFELIVREST